MNFARIGPKTETTNDQGKTTVERGEESSRPKNKRERHTHTQRSQTNIERNKRQTYRTDRTHTQHNSKKKGEEAEGVART